LHHQVCINNGDLSYVVRITFDGRAEDHRFVVTVPQCETVRVLPCGHISGPHSFYFPQIVKRVWSEVVEDGAIIAGHCRYVDGSNHACSPAPVYRESAIGLPETVSTYPGTLGNIGNGWTEAQQEQHAAEEQLLNGWEFGGDDPAVEARGLALLKENLTPAQLESYEANQYFEVKGENSGTTYRIRRGRQQNVFELDKVGNEVCGFCFTPVGNLCTSDSMLCQKIALETNEGGVLKVANRFRETRNRSALSHL
jgi:hypothetical protein